MNLVPYPSYVPAESHLFGELPAGWTSAPIKAVASCNDDALPETAPEDTEIEYIDISSVDSIDGIIATEPMRFGVAPSRARRLVRDGDVIVSTVRTYLRAIAKICNPSDGLVVSTGFAVIRPRTVEPAFLGHVLKSEPIIGEIIARSTGVSYPAINPSELVSIKIPVPPEADRRAIATFLDRETSKIDTLIAEQRTLIERLREKRIAIASELVTKGLDPKVSTRDSGIEWIGKIPSHWRVERNASLFRERIEDGAEGLPILSISLHSGVSDEEQSSGEDGRLKRRIEDKTSYSRVYKGDLAYNMMRAWQGGLGAVSTDGMVSPAYVVLSPQNGVESDYFEALFRTPCYMRDIERYSKGITSFRWRLYWEDFKQLRSPVPPLKEQQEIISALQFELSKIDPLESAAHESIALLQEHRSALITAVVTGKVDVRESVKESA